MRGIIAVNNLGYIGLDGELPWKSSEDLKHFKKLTMAHSCLVGWNTYQTLPKLEGRMTIVDSRGEPILSSTPKEGRPKQDWSFIIGDDINPDDNLWCIGGKKTYEKYAPYIHELHISHIDDNTIGDTMFPDFSRLNPDCKVVNHYFGSD
jgi:dihydrofolate reductase